MKEQRRHQKMRRRTLIIALFILLALGGAASYFLRDEGPDENAPQIVEVTQGDIENVVTAQGKLEPKDYVDVGAQVSGMVEKLHAETGDTVKQGDLIAEIDPDVYESQVKGDEARLKTLQAQLAEQQALVRQAQQKLDRNRKLIKSKSISAEVLEDAQTAFDVASAQLQSLDAQIEEAQSTLEGNRANLSYTKIYAPMDGTVVAQSVKAGQTINANQTAPVIVQVANLDVMTVKAQVAEADINKLFVDMPVYFTTLGAQSRRWQGKVRQILPTPETVNDVVLYNVLADVENTDHQLMTGMTTQMFFVLGAAQDVAIVPASALARPVHDRDNTYTVTLENGEERVIVTGIADRARAEVKEGLQSGDKIRILPAGGDETTPAGQPRMPRRMSGVGRL